jgi:hypothetical protein
VAGPCKPGNGYGDKNHCHTGPPGQNGSNGPSTQGVNGKNISSTGQALTPWLLGGLCLVVLTSLGLPALRRRKAGRS